jgi:hypothetical protein
MVFCTEYSYQGSVEIRVEELEAQLSKMYSPSYSGGIQQYIDVFQVATAQSDTLEPDGEYSDLKKSGC